MEHAVAIDGYAVGPGHVIRRLDGRERKRSHSLQAKRLPAKRGNGCLKLTELNRMFLYTGQTEDHYNSRLSVASSGRGSGLSAWVPAASS